MAKTHLEPKYSTKSQSMMKLHALYSMYFHVAVGDAANRLYVQGKMMLGEQIQKGTTEKWTAGDKELGS